MTSGPIARTLILFALPTLASNVLQSLNGSVNAVLVGRFLGEAALAATANANNIMFLIFAAIFGFGMAATVMVGQAAGRRDMDAARRAFGGAVGFCAIIGIIMAGVGWWASPAILRALATPDSAFPLALTYLRVMCVAIPSSVLSVMIAMGLRGTGDAVTPLRFMMLSVGLDLALNPVLILGLGPIPAMGIAGSALSTALAGTISLIGLIGWIYARDLPLRLRGAELAYLRPRWRELRFIIMRGMPMGAQMLIISGAGLIMAGLVNRHGLLTAAAFGATLQLWAYIQMPALAIGAAVTAMASQNIGANLWHRVGRITRAGVFANVGMTGLLIALLLAFDRPVLALFLGGDSPAIGIARHMQFIASWSFLLFGATMVLFGTMRANGAVYEPLIILALSLYPVRLGFYAVMNPIIGTDALWWSFPAGSLVSLALAILTYRYGPWRRRAPTRAYAGASAGAGVEPSAENGLENGNKPTR
ncbi:MAG: MATE family efflux transporter [Sphingopyxis sp.]